MHMHDRKLCDERVKLEKELRKILIFLIKNDRWKNRRKNKASENVEMLVALKIDIVASPSVSKKTYVVATQFTFRHSYSIRTKIYVFRSSKDFFSVLLFPPTFSSFVFVVLLCGVYFTFIVRMINGNIEIIFFNSKNL